MITITSENLPQRLSIRMILEEALSRGWQAQAYRHNDSHAILTRPDGKELSIFSSCPPTTSYFAAHVADDKFLTHTVLEDAKLPVLATYRCETEDQARKAVQMIITSGKKYVVKPLDAGHGNGITVGLKDIEQLPGALAFANQFSKVVIIQTYQESPIDLRVLCIGYKVAAILERIPARVKGDGIHTITELIDIENKQRGAQYTADLSVIPLDRAQSFLGGAAQSIPTSDEVVPVLGMANLGMGGEGHDVTQEVPTELIEMAEKAARVMQLPVCGVDFLVSKVPNKNDSIEVLSPSITEVNKCPALFMHEHPKHGEGRNVTRLYIDYLATL